MKRARLVLVVAVAAAALGLPAAPALACQPEYCPECSPEAQAVNTAWRKRFGYDLFWCPSS